MNPTRILVIKHSFGWDMVTIEHAAIAAAKLQCWMLEHAMGTTEYENEISAAVIYPELDDIEEVNLSDEQLAFLDANIGNDVEDNEF